MNFGTSRRAAVVGAVVLVVAGTAVPASAKPVPGAPARSGQAVPAGFGSWAEVYSLQDKLNAAAVRILETADAGNPSIVADPLSRELVVHWHGEVPAAVKDVARKAAVPIRFRPARYALRELTAEARRLVADARVAEVAPLRDGSGLAVKVTTMERGIGTDILGTSKVKLAVEIGSRPQALGGRQHDSPAFWGGARYRTQVGGCSTGFGLKVFNQPNVYMLSAGHCGENGQVATIPPHPGGITYTGTLLAKDACRDTLVINFPNGVAGAVYTGPWEPSSSVVVNNAGSDFVGNLITTSGATSGQHDNVPVQAVNAFVAVGGIPCPSVGPLTRAGLTGNQCVVAPGDSGGPVLLSGVFQGRGTISAGNLGSATCSPAAPSGGAVSGANTVYYAPLLRPPGDPQIGSLQLYGAWVLP